MKSMLIATSLLVALVTLATPASATSGRQAVGMCIDAPGCTWAMDKDGKNIDILTADGTYIHCADATSECTIPRRAGPSKKLNAAPMGGVFATSR